MKAHAAPRFSVSRLPTASNSSSVIPGSEIFASSSRTWCTTRPASRMRAISSWLLISIPIWRSGIDGSLGDAVAEHGQDATFDVVGRAHSVDAPEQASRLVVIGQDRGLVLVL